MKNTIRYIFAALAVSVSLSIGADAQVVATKKAVNNYDGTYTLTMEAYATGSESVVVTDNKTPIDAVLVLDCSQSMSTTISSSSASYLMSTTTLNDLLKGTSGTYYIYWTDGKYYQISVSRSGSTRTATFNDGTNTYGVQYNGSTYSTPSGSTELPVAYRSVALHTRATSSVSRLNALKEACSIFLNNLMVDQVQWNAEHTDKQISHRVSIISFNSSATTRVKLINGNVVDNYTTLLSTINGLGMSTNTCSDKGMANAITEIGSASSDASKLVVFFTDGMPADTKDTFSTEIANGAIANSKTIKASGASVFALSVIEITSGSNMDKYMNYISSNYPNAESMTAAGTQASSDFYTIATNQAALNKAFDSISGSAISGGTSATIDATSEVRDVVSESFMLPAGSESSAIKVYTDKFKEIQSGVYIFENDPQDAGLTPTIDGKKVTVKGFDFKTNYCGYRIAKDDDGNIQYESDGKTPKTVPGGMKLIIKVTIVPDPDAEDTGFAATNDDSQSGIYTADGTPVINFVTVPSTVYTNADMTVKITGLDTYDSAIFTVTADVPLNIYGTSEEFKRTIALSGNNSEVVIKAPVTYYDSAADEVKFVTYTVTPQTWSWAYTISPGSTSKVLIKILEDESRETDNVFEFEATKNTDVVVTNDENSRTNEFDYHDDSSSSSGDGSGVVIY